jgi:S-adenosyl-L-methionine hydrolase (adenosine-forming)
MRPVCFLSDFGLGDDFVGLCKGVILRAAPGVTIVDLTHEVPGFGIEAGAEILAHATRYMPEDAVYLAVVDPGVGTERRAVALSTEGGGCLVGPDNGLLLPAADFLGGVAEAVLLTNPDFHVHPVSATFHGRDVFSPAAAHLAAGGDLRELGDGVDPAYLIRVELPGTQRLDGGAVAVTVVGVDRYGNARLSAAQDGAGFGFGALLEIDTGDAPDSGMLVRYVETFGSSKAGDLVLVPDSHRRLSLCVNRGSAARALSLRAGDPVLLTPIEYGPRDARP